MITIGKTFNSGENKEFMEKLKNGDKSARETLIFHNLGIIADIINHKFIYFLDNDLLSYEDLFMTGIEGLIKAIDYFKLEKNFKFSTYAYKCINNELSMYLKKNYKPLETSIEEKLDKTSKEKNFFSYKYLNINEDITIHIESIETLTELKNVFEKLNPYEKRIVSLYMGINSKKLSGKEIGKILGCSQSYCNRIKKKTLKKMRDQLNEK